MTTRAKTTIAGGIIIVVLAGAWYFFQSPVGVEKLEAPTPVEKSTPTVALPLRPTVNKAFAAGEKLRFKIFFKGATVGNATIEVKMGPIVNNRPTMQYVLKAESTKFFDSFYKVRDENVSTVDQDSLYSVAFDQDLREGRYRAIRHYSFDYVQRKFTSSEQGKNKAKRKDGSLNEPVHDVLSALYSIRTLALAPGIDVHLTIFRDDTGKALRIKIDPEVKELKTAIGDVSCLRVEPLIQGDSLFKTKDNRLVVWLTHDAKKLPVLIEATSSVGLVQVKIDQSEKEPPFSGS